MGDVRVGLLYDSVSANTGDIAIGIAGRQELARHGIHDVEVLDPFAPDTGSVDTVIVGGGELLRPLGDAFYDAFRPVYGSILNAVGVWQTADELEYLAGYDYVSARSSAEAAVLRQYVTDVRVTPCTTTTLESEPYDLGLEAGEPVVGIHLVPHTLALCPELVEIIDAIPERKVFIPFTHYNYDDSFMRALPFDRTGTIQLPRLSPLELHSVLGQMSYVVTSSLHATLFAYSQNVPFVTAYQEKVINYLGDRRLGRFVYASDDQLRAALAEVQAGGIDFGEAVAVDKAAVHDAYATYAGLVRRRAGESHRNTRQGPVSTRDDGRNAEHLRAEQREHVIENRDVAVHHLTRRLMAAQAEASLWHKEADRLGAELEVARAKLEPRSAKRLLRRAVPRRVLVWGRVRLRWVRAAFQARNG